MGAVAHTFLVVRCATLTAVDRVPVPGLVQWQYGTGGVRIMAISPRFHKNVTFYTKNAPFTLYIHYRNTNNFRTVAIVEEKG